MQQTLVGACNVARVYCLTTYKCEIMIGIGRLIHILQLVELHGASYAYDGHKTGYAAGAHLNYFHRLIEARLDKTQCTRNFFAFRH